MASAIFYTCWAVSLGLMRGIALVILLEVSVGVTWNAPRGDEGERSSALLLAELYIYVSVVHVESVPRGENKNVRAVVACYFSRNRATKSRGLYESLTRVASNPPGWNSESDRPRLR